MIGSFADTRQDALLRNPPFALEDWPTSVDVEWRCEAEPTADLLQELEQLRRLDQLASPFSAPAFLQTCADDRRSQGATMVIVRGVRESRTVALWPLMLDRGGTLRFLQGDDADHCTCLAAPGVGPHLLGHGLAHVLREIHPARVSFKNVPPWGPTLPAVKAGLAHSGWSARAFAATACPVLRTNPGPGAVEAFLHEVNSHKRLRNYENRLKRLPGYAFEAVCNGDDLERWADEFCDVHEWRWNTSDTPSEYRHRAARERLLRQLTAWNQDGVLCRFSIRIDGRRIAFAIGLLGGGRLIYHRPAAAPGWSELRPGHVLVRLMGVWMGERGLHVLDFGMGDEEYKGRYAQHDDKLWRVYATPRRVSVTLARAFVEEQIRKTPAAQRCWDRTANALVRGKLRGAASNAWNALRSGRRGWHPTSAGKLVPPRRLGREVLYRALGGPAATSHNVVALRPFDALERIDDGAHLLPIDRASAIERLYAGTRLLGLIEGDRPVAAAWILEEQALPECFEKDHPAVSYRIEPYALAKAARKPGVLARFLEGVRSDLAPGAPIFIVVPESRAAVRQELACAGFEPVAVRPRTTGRDHATSFAEGWRIQPPTESRSHHDESGFGSV